MSNTLQYVEFGEKGNWVSVEYFLEHMDDKKKNIFEMLKYFDKTKPEFSIKLSYVRNFIGHMWHGTYYLQIEQSKKSDIRFYLDEGYEQKLVYELEKFKDIELRLEGILIENV